MLFICYYANGVLFLYYRLKLYWQDSCLRDMSLSVNAIFIVNAPISKRDSFPFGKYDPACESLNQSRTICRSTHEKLRAIVHSYVHAYIYIHIGACVDLPIYNLNNIVASSPYVWILI